MTSFGVAPRTAETGQILRRIHPAPIKPVVKPAVRGVQLTTSAGACYERLMTEAGSITCPIDFSGFSSEALCHDRGQAKESTLSWEIARLQEILGSGDAPSAIYFILITLGRSRHSTKIRLWKRKKGWLWGRNAGQQWLGHLEDVP